MSQSENPSRVTKYDLITVWKDKKLINIDSQAPNKVFMEYLQIGKYIEGITYIKPETKFGGSRFDFYVEAEPRKVFIEVKGVTLEESDVAMFPDAPTLRGVKHLNGLVACINDGYEAQVVFVIQMRGVRYFTPNSKLHPEFSGALAVAKNAGVDVIALDCAVEPGRLKIKDYVPVKL